MGLLMGEIRPVLTELLPLFVLEKLFLVYCSFTIYDISMKFHSYVYHRRLHIVIKLFQFKSYLSLIDPKNVF